MSDYRKTIETSNVDFRYAEAEKRQKETQTKENRPPGSLIPSRRRPVTFKTPDTPKISSVNTTKGKKFLFI